MMLQGHGAATTGTEGELRERLGAPADAPQVMVVAESTHWDPNWLLTSTEYFRFWVRRTLDRALAALVEEPRRVFSLECAFFPDLFWEHRPEKRDLFCSLVNEGRLRFSGCGVTTPDTLLPEDELLLRDLLIGQEWLRSRGMTKEPRVLYLPDSFGHSPGIPSLLTAAGVPYAAVCRIDGMRFPGADLESATKFPRPGTSAAHLMAEGTADFVWRGPDGSEVLAHWMTHGYGHGDMIASRGLSRALGLPTAWADRRQRHVAARIEGYIDQLDRMARTPYLLLAIGFDFVMPVPRLVELLDRWNEAEYERTGVWLVNAGLDDYMDLVAQHRPRLPTMALDPNPYWMGFYASRPDIKAACRNLGRQLISTDNERARASIAGAQSPGRSHGPGQAAHSDAWWRAVTSNHHDFVTGTAPDRVANGEQTRWLRGALADTAPTDTAATTSPATTGAQRSVALPADGNVDLSTSWIRDGHQVTVTTPWSTAVFDEEQGGALVSLTGPGGKEQLGAPSLELLSYAESGGLWRMGHEFNGGRWAPHDRSSDHHATITVTSLPEAGICVLIRASLDDRSAEIAVELGAHGPAIVVHTSVTPPNRRTVTLAVHQLTTIARLAMHQPGGMVIRDLERWYVPTFWPLHSFASVVPPGATEGPSGDLTVAVAVPTALHATAAGAVEIVVARTATKELAYGFLPVLAPAWGRRWGTQQADLAMEWAPCGGAAAAVTAGRRLVRRVDEAVGRSSPAWLVDTDDPLVEVVTVKVADRGDGVIVRLRNWAVPGPVRTVGLRLVDGTDAAIIAAWRADSRERNRDALPVADGATRVEIDSHLTTIRLSTRIPHASGFDNAAVGSPRDASPSSGHSGS